MSSKLNRFTSGIAWVVAILLAVMAIYLGWRFFLSFQGGGQLRMSEVQTPEPPVLADAGAKEAKVNLPQYLPQEELEGIRREASVNTIIPNRPRQAVTGYTVASGDSVFEIASKFNITPETVLWANFDLLNDNPDMISVGMDLNIPPIDGVYYQWQEGDTLESVAARFEAQVENILSFTGNLIDLINPTIAPGAWVMIPEGRREFRQWIIPVIPRGRAGVSKAVYGGGACSGEYEGAYGSGAFVWPAGNHVISGNDYWSGHLGVDIAAGEGAPVYAADSGVVVFAGTATGGYGNMVMIDHGNGYQTLYAHLNRVTASCGQSIGSGSTLGYSGSTGNSTGPHLHFEVRYQGGFVNPWFVLPAP